MAKKIVNSVDEEIVATSTVESKPKQQTKALSVVKLDLSNRYVVIEVDVGIDLDGNIELGEARITSEHQDRFTANEQFKINVVKNGLLG